MAAWNELRFPSSMYAFHRQDYQAAILSLEMLGFTNIQEAPVYDLEDDSRIPEGAVESVSVDGQTNFKRGYVFQKDTEIVVTYHLLRANEPTEAPETTATTPPTTKPTTSTSTTTTSTSIITTSSSITDIETTDTTYESTTSAIESVSSESLDETTLNSSDITSAESSETSDAVISTETTDLTTVETTTMTAEPTQTTTTTTTSTTKATTTIRKTTATIRAAATTTKVKNDNELGLSYPRPTSTLKKGNSGKEAGWLQTALNQVMKSGLIVNSNFGKDTDAAVRAFQTRCSLGTDGIAGPKTINKLVAILSGAEKLPAETQPPTTKATTRPSETQARVTPTQAQPVYTQPKTQPVFVREPTYIINKKSGKIHKTNCPSVSKMNASNRKEWYGTLHRLWIVIQDTQRVIIV